MVLNVVLGRDLIGKVFGSKWPDEKPIQVMRIMTAFVIIVSALLSIDPPALVLDISGSAFLVIICATAPAMVLGIWWDKATKAAAYVTIFVMTFVTGGSWLYAFYVQKSPHWFFLSDPSNKIPTPHQFYWIPISFLLFIVVSLLTQPPKPEIVKKYSLDIRPEY